MAQVVHRGILLQYLVPLVLLAEVVLVVFKLVVTWCHVRAIVESRKGIVLTTGHCAGKQGWKLQLVLVVVILTVYGAQILYWFGNLDSWMAIRDYLVVFKHFELACQVEWVVCTFVRGCVSCISLWIVFCLFIVITFIVLIVFSVILYLWLRRWRRWWFREVPWKIKSRQVFAQKLSIHNFPLIRNF